MKEGERLLWKLTKLAVAVRCDVSYICHCPVTLILVIRNILIASSDQHKAVVACCGINQS
jgi:hypothetical protein